MWVTKLPAYENEFAPDGKIYFSLRQTRLGFNSWSQTPLGALKANFEFDLFGVGPDIGQTTFRFRKAWRSRRGQSPVDYGLRETEDQRPEQA